MCIKWLCNDDRLLYILYQSGILKVQGQTSDPSLPLRTIRKRGSRHKLFFSPFFVNSTPRQTAVCCLAGLLAAQRPGGTALEPAPSHDERRWPIVSCYWKSAHREGGGKFGGRLQLKGMPLAPSATVEVSLCQRWKPTVTHFSSANCSQHKQTSDKL